MPEAPKPRPSHPVRVDLTSSEGGVERAVPAAVFTHQCQLSQRPHRPVPAQNRIHQLEQNIRTGGETGVELAPDARQLTQGSRRSA
ncbi:hypothetical protein SAM23877_7338 [Streptomyces ambofaciens ATCC 23877]|uniref:Uncharacterized protein n=1 Tax=Streptomyces ambofaciens (strain ATCC 23877 / 3486 / DSM 40053 / JCM 4204 / NBRC 12836 / NRRL B-2516) TaxID=278992 RepID=A0A0K2B524_STRA7|nr:hypothetical protein SAM23877_7338 [Streptomyces ambofaciens ATCC 23877]